MTERTIRIRAVLKAMTSPRWGVRMRNERPFIIKWSPGARVGVMAAVGIENRRMRPIARRRKRQSRTSTAIESRILVIGRMAGPLALAGKGGVGDVLMGAYARRHSFIRTTLPRESD